MVTFIKPSSLNLSDLIYTHFCFSSCYLELNQWLCYTESCTLSLYHPCISISGGNMLGCCLLSPFGFVAYNFSSSLGSLLPLISLSHALPFCFFLSFCFTVSITLRYGYYGDSCILLGPASSRLMKTSSVFVKQLQVSNKDNNQVILHAFNEKPELSSQTNWTVSNLCLVEAYKSKVTL